MNCFSGVRKLFRLALSMFGVVLPKDTRAPHEKWPEVLDWQKGDRFDEMYSYGHSEVTLVAVQEDGYAVTDYFGDRDWIPVRSLVGHNRSLRTRRVNADLKQSGEYMELLNQFHIAVKELEARDKRNGIRLVG